jgi:hypothetical protein
MTPTEARTTLHQALDGRADHARFVSISSRQISNGVGLFWFDYLSREEGSLLVVHESQLQQTVETLLSELHNCQLPLYLALPHSWCNQTSSRTLS